MHNIDLSNIKKRAWSELYSILPLFLEKKNTEIIKTNSELLFLSIFLSVENKDVDESIKKFINYYREKNIEKEISNPSTLLLIDIYLNMRQEKRIFHDFSYSFTGLENFDFTKKEIECYLSILLGKTENKVLAYFNSDKLKQMKSEIIDVNEIYYFTHDIFYLSYLNTNREFFEEISEENRYLIKEYIYNYIVYCMIIENIDLLGELLISMIMLEGMLETENEIIDKSLWFIEQYLIGLSKNDLKDMHTFLSVYHTLLVICMLTELL